jgi:hypothetical protein
LALPIGYTVAMPSNRRIGSFYAGLWHAFFEIGNVGSGG